MNSCRYKIGVTLVEILTVVAIIAILASIVVGIATRIDNKAKEQLAQNTIAIIADALEQFADYEYRYNDFSTYVDPAFTFIFPLDCNDFTKAQLETALKDALGSGNVLITPDHNDPNFSGSEALYFFLSKVPDSKKTLERIDSSLITSKDKNKQDMTITIDVVKEYPLFRIIDPWGRTLRYDYYDENPPPLIPSQIKDMQDSKKVFPVITSAGQDGVFGTDDDITNRN